MRSDDIAARVDVLRRRLQFRIDNDAGLIKGDARNLQVQLRVRTSPHGHKDFVNHRLFNSRRAFDLQNRIAI